MQKITLIAAMSENRVIGANNDIPWHIPEDFAFFKAYTSHKPVIMGRKTWDSLPRKPLPNRRNMVITRQKNWQEEGAEVFSDLTNAIVACASEEEIIIMGGAQIYEQAIGLATDLRLTEVKLSVSGDAFFPKLSNDWQEVSRQSHLSNKNIAFDFVHYVRNIQAA